MVTNNRQTASEILNFDLLMFASAAPGSMLVHGSDLDRLVFDLWTPMMPAIADSILTSGKISHAQGTSLAKAMQLLRKEFLPFATEASIADGKIQECAVPIAYSEMYFFEKALGFR